MWTPISLWDRCYHESAVENIEPVNGSYTRTRCSFMRAYGGKCGVDPKLYQPKELPKRSLLQRIFNLRQTSEK